MVTETTVLSTGRSIWLRVVAWLFKLGGGLFLLMGLFTLIGWMLHWPTSPDAPSPGVALLMLCAMAAALIVTGVLLARRERAGAVLALIVSLYPLAFVILGSRPLSWVDIVATVITIAVVASIWPELSRGPRRSPQRR